MVLHVEFETAGRKWIGAEIGPVDGIVERLSNLDDETKHLERLRAGYNHLFLPNVASKRMSMGRWTVGNIPKGTRKRERDDGEFDDSFGHVKG